jgi:hypothetical protein
MLCCEVPQPRTDRKSRWAGKVYIDQEKVEDDTLCYVAATQSFSGYGRWLCCNHGEYGVCCPGLRIVPDSQGVWGCGCLCALERTRARSSKQGATEKQQQSGVPQETLFGTSE